MLGSLRTGFLIMPPPLRVLHAHSDPTLAPSGVNFFGDNPGFDSHSSFATFGVAMVTLTRLAIGDAWEEVRACVVKKKQGHTSGRCRRGT